MKRWLRAHLTGILAISIAAAAVGAFFLGLYPYRGYSMPIGWDTPRYLSETNLVAERGLSGVEELTPPPTKVLGGRVSFSILTLTLSSLSTLSTFKVAALIPVVAAVALALAAGAFVSAALQRREWEAAAVAVVVGVSPTLIRLMAPETYSENLLAVALLLGALVLMVAAEPDAGGLTAAVLLLAGGGLSHGPSFAIVAGAIALTAAWFLPRSWRAWRRDRTPLLSTPSGHLAAAGVGAAGLLSAALLGLLGTGVDTFRQGRTRLVAKLRADVPLYRFPLTLPVAGVGLASFLASGRRSGRSGTPSVAPTRQPPWPRSAMATTLLSGWALLTLLGFALFLAGRASPAHRFLALLAPFPVLVGAGVVAVSDLVARRTRPFLGAAVVLAALAGLVGLGVQAYYHDLPDQRRVLWMEEGKVRDAATAAAYLDAAGVPETAPVVFLVDDRGPKPADYTPLMAQMIRSVMPAARIENAYLFVGEPQDYFAGRPTLRGAPGGYDFNSLRFFAAVEPLLDERPVTLLLASFNGAYGEYAEEHPDQVAAPNVAVLQGPPLPAPISAAAISFAPRGPVQLVLVGAGTIGFLALAGLGWSLALFPRTLRSFEALALAPAMGISALVIAGLVLDTIGIRLTGIAGALTPLVVAAAGFGASVPRLRRHGGDLFPAR